MSDPPSWWDRARRVIPGGVNSPVRAYAAVGGSPPFIRRGQGARLVDTEGQSYVDYVMSWGPLILGHRHPQVIEAIREALQDGTSFGAPTEREVILAEILVSALPSVKRVRLVNSGTEAAMSALRLARAYTGRDRIVKFEGCYHGHVDSLLIKAGSGATTLGVPSSPGIPASVAADTIVLPYNDEAALTGLFSARGQEIAAVIVEPVAGNMGCVRPEKGFLETLRTVTADSGALLIFDEVITGFRVAYGGAQDYYGVQPDLTCLGKIIGGGLPVGAYGGKAEIMDQVAPRGPVYQAGTLSGNPLAVAAGTAALEVLRTTGPYRRLEQMGRYLADGLLQAAAAEGVPVSVNQIGSLLTLFFTDQQVVDYKTAVLSDQGKYARFHRNMLDRGIYLPPSQFECWFLSTAHTEADLEKTLEVSRSAFRAVRCCR